MTKNPLTNTAPLKVRAGFTVIYEALVRLIDAVSDPEWNNP